MLIQLGVFCRWPTLRSWQIIDIIWDIEPEYKYKKLRAGHICLLLLHWRNHIDAVTCTLFDVEPKATPLYVAISYMWSDIPETGDILANGFRLRVQKSAYMVLENQSLMWTPRLLWVDYICINQKDKEEKVSQIQLMKDIYSNAFFVPVCLQPSPIADNEAADDIKAYQFPGFLRLSENDKEVVKLSQPSMAADMIQELH
jgi:hypothetical protein